MTLSWGFTNLNISVFESNAELYHMDTHEKLTTFHTNAYDANNGEMEVAISEEGHYYMSVEGLTILDKEYGKQKAINYFKLGLSAASDIVLVFKSAKAIQAGTQIGKVAVEGIIPSVPKDVGDAVSTTNLIVSETDTIKSKKSLWVKVRDTFLNLVPFVGTKNHYDNVTNTEPKVRVE